MKVLGITAILTVALLVCSTANAQPGCHNTPYGPANYCHFASFPDHNYFVGRIETLDKEQPGKSYGKIFLEVTKINDIWGSSENNLKLVTEDDVGCVHDLVVGGNYIFGVPKSTADGSGTRRFSRLSLERLTDAEKAQVIDNVLSVLNGKRQPILYGRVARPGGTPFSDVKIIARGENGQFSTMTDTFGDFKFDDLPRGEYEIAADYPTGYMPADNYPTTGESTFQSNRPEGWLCGTRMDLATSLSARISGTYSSGSQGRHPNFNLLDASNGFSDIHNLQANSHGPSRRFTTENGKSGFAFDHLKPGKYVLRLGSGTVWNPLTTFYYPGVRSARDATILEIGLGTRLDLNFEIQPFELVTVRGRTQLTDGTPINAGLIFVDAEVPSVYLVYSRGDRERTDFVFTTIKDRPVFICAGTQRVLDNGERRHVFSKVPVSPAENLEDLIITLDKVVPPGTTWHEHCRNGR